MNLLMIKELRKKNKLSLRKLAELSYSYLNLLEAGKRCNSTYQTLEKIASALKVETKKIFD
ncbi:helix-turn-helix domain-containing protein [Ruminiclostridium cellobioparum]|uniref:Helix-turn-helix protein n=1 Tax=Ruminiclostridium cellobioparum subsp. termitidis CT1112 TaxID=1195236 RepID=S0FUQ8_RUMCE|nr:helix-turn-helix protein [Ruminiclostridium cellobioparum subsp. termitidis CT1112]